MIPLSTRGKESIKTALAMVIAFAIALGMGWDKPYWAGFAVALVSLDTAGASLNKAAMRMLGTLVGGAAGLVLIVLFPQERWLMLVAWSLYAGIGVYMLTGNRYQYFWFVATFVALLIVANSAPPDGLSAFQLAVVRVQETAMGILVYSLVSTFLWPKGSRGDLEKASRELAATQRALYHAYPGLMTGQGVDAETQPMRLRQVALVNQVGQALAAAETDSYAVRELRDQWREYRHLSVDVMESLERWRETFAQLEDVELGKVLPNLDAVCGELDMRFAETERILSGEAPKRSSQALKLEIDKAEARALGPFQKAAVAVAKAQLDQLETLSRSLVDVVREIRGHERETPRPERPTDRPWRFQLDLDRLGAAANVVTTLFVAFFVWVFVDPPMHAMFVFLATLWAMVAALAGVSLVKFVPGFVIGLPLGGILYLFVMPHLSSFIGLGLMIFFVTFAIVYLCWTPRLRALGPMLLALFNLLMFVDNQQSYSFAQYANTCAGVLLSIALAIFVSYIPRSPRPEKVFLRLVRRFLRQTEFMVSRLALDRDQRSGWAERWKLAVYSGSLLTLPNKLARLAPQIDYALLQDCTPEKVQALTTTLQAIAYRLSDLMHVRELPHAELLVREFHDELRNWRLVVQEQLGQLAEDPDEALASGVDLEERLTARIGGFDARIRESYQRPETATLSEQDYENFYRYLAGLRSVSKAGIGFIRLAQTFDWPRWREPRF